MTISGNPCNRWQDPIQVPEGIPNLSDQPRRAEPRNRAMKDRALGKPLSFGEAGRQVTLTTRQREVLALIAEGKTTKEVAVLLGVSFKTAITHRAHLMQKLGIHNAAQLVKRAIRMGLLEP